MNWYPRLYLSKTAEAKKEKLIQKIESGKTPVNTYLLTLAPGERNQLEILPVWDLRFRFNRQQLPLIVGIGCGKAEAFELVRRITEDVYRETGGAGLKKYFEAGMEKEL